MNLPQVGFKKLLRFCWNNQALTVCRRGGGGAGVIRTGQIHWDWAESFIPPPHERPVIFQDFHPAEISTRSFYCGKPCSNQNSRIVVAINNSSILVARRPLLLHPACVHARRWIFFCGVLQQALPSSKSWDVPWNQATRVTSQIVRCSRSFSLEGENLD